MRKIKDVLRLKLDAQLSHQQIAAALGISKGVVTKYVGLAAAAGLDWPQVKDTDEPRWSGACWWHRSGRVTTSSRTMAACTRSCAARV